MNKRLTAVLFDGTEIELADATFQYHFIVVCQNRGDFNRLWNKMNEANLQEVQIRENGLTICTITGMELDNVQIIPNTDGTLTAHFYFVNGEYLLPPDEHDEEPEEEEPSEEPEA